MDPIAKTAYYCCGVRMLDARSANPVCGDDLAERFMDADALALFQPFERFKAPNRSNAARHRIIDDLLRARLADQPGLTVVLLGAGFDTRAFRLSGGQWLELDQAPLIHLKEAVLPATDAPNPLTRVAVDFARNALPDILSAHCPADTPIVVVMEGVSMYLSPDALGGTVAALQQSLPRHTLICDLMTRHFARRYSARLRAQITTLGGDFAELADDPSACLVARGYRSHEPHSIAGRAVALGAVRIPKWVFNTLLRSLRDGYRVHVFDYP